MKNRNHFKQEFELHSKCSCESIWNHFYSVGSERLDHPEAYHTWDSEIVLVCSNYDYMPPAGLEMRKYKDLYDYKATTYVGNFNTIVNAIEACRKISKQQQESKDIEIELAMISQMTREDIDQLVSTATVEHPYFKEKVPYYDAFKKRLEEVYGRT